MKLKQLFLLLALTPLALPVWAGTALDQLNDFHNHMQTLQADFEQQLINDKGQTQQQVSGKVYIQRPGQFRWDYRAPYEQLIMGDPHRLIIYDVDLEQVTVKAIDEALGQTPAVILSGNSDLAENFYITELEPSEGLQRIELSPRSNEGSFVRMELGFRDAELHRVELLDGFGQLTVITLQQVQRNQPLPADIFSFEPPEGVDVVGDLN